MDTNEVMSEKPKKIIKPAVLSFPPAWASVLCGIYFISTILTGYLRTIRLGTLSPAGLLVYSLFTLVMVASFINVILNIIKNVKNIYLYDDFFIVGKSVEKNYYRNLHYFYIMGGKPDVFQTIFYERENGKYGIIPALFYHGKEFKQLQEDIVEATYSYAMEKINNGGEEEFSFLPAKKKFYSLTQKKGLEKVKRMMEEADKIKITEEHFAIEGKEYKWGEYRISVKSGNISVNWLNGEEIVDIPKAKIDRPDLLEALVETLNKSWKNKKI